MKSENLTQVNHCNETAVQGACKPSISSLLDEATNLLINCQDKVKYIGCNLDNELGHQNSPDLTKEDDSVMESVRLIVQLASETNKWLNEITTILF